MRGLRRFAFESSLSLVFGCLFLAVLLGQSLAGWADANDLQAAHGLAYVSYWSFVASSTFAVDVAENWQSEYLQFSLYIIGTVWLVQRGSTESKEVDDVGTGTDAEQKVGRFATAQSPSWARRGGWRTAVYGRSLGLVMGAIFLGSWAAQSVAGRAQFSEDQLAGFQDPVTWWQYVTGPDFWNRTLQNWQSELLAVGSMVILSVYLRQRGSPESKPVGDAHDKTASSA